MSKPDRESVFDLLNATVRECVQPQFAVEIPSDIWNVASSTKSSATSKIAGSTIRSFDFELNGNYFASANSLNVNSLFFEYALKVTLNFTVKPSCEDQHKRLPITVWNKKLNTDQFFVVNFVSNLDIRAKSAMLDEDFIEKVLRGGVKANGSIFNFLGCSNSQVQNRSFYFMQGSLCQCEQVLNQLINLQKLNLKGVQKRTKYVGLLFTGCQQIVNLPEKVRINTVEDIERNGYNFTDGCGFISYALAEWVWRNNAEIYKKWSYVPSVWQIRYYGDGKLCKGVLVVDNREKTEHSITFRHSMVKVAVNDFGLQKANKCLRLKLGIVSTNHQAKIGKLNKQVIALLSANIPKEKLQSIQDFFLQQTENARTDSVAALHCYSLKLNLPMFGKLLRQHKASTIPSEFVSLPFQVENLDSEKLKIPIAGSRLLIGASFPEIFHGRRLRESECVVLSELGPVLGTVAVCRSPSYSLGDIRVLTAVKPPENSPICDLKNVIFFSTEGSRPDPDKMSGGDLDGDLYLVIWDQRILEHSEILSKVPAESYEVPNHGFTPLGNKTSKSDKRAWIRYVAQWENSMLAQIDSTFFQLAAQRGINSHDCKDLSALFSRAVDQIPSDLDLLKQKMAKCSRIVEQGPFVPDFEQLPIWEKMWEKQKSLLEKLRKTRHGAIEVSDWERFFKTLVNKTEAEIVQIFSDKNIMEAATVQQIEKMKSSWILLSSINFDPPLPGNVECKPDLLPLCRFDCVQKSCPKRHPQNLEWYNSWNTQVKRELNFFIVPIKVRIDKLNEILSEQESRLKFALTLYDEKYEQIKQRKLVLMQKFEVLEKHSGEVEAALNYAIQLEKLKIYLEEIKRQREPDFFTGLMRELQNILANVFLKRNRKLTAEERELLDRYNKITTDIEDKTKELKNALRTEKDSYRVVKRELNPMFYTPEMHFIDAKDEICRRQKSCERLMKVITDKSKSYRYPILSEEVFGLEDTLNSKITKITSQQTKLSALKDRIKSMLNQIAATTQLKQNSEQSSIVIGTETAPSLWNLSQTSVTETLKQNLLQTEQKLEILNRREADLQKNLARVYCPAVHQNTLKAIEKETEKVNPFNLALCATLNEVNSRFYQYASENPDKRVSSNCELKMCLLREKNRCQQEFSEKQLPIFSKRFEIMNALKDHNAMIVVAHTGSGKSTQVPQYLADDLHHVLKDLRLKNFPKVACTQPRRVAATSIAQRVSLEYSGSIDSVKMSKENQEEPTPVVHSSDKAEIVAYPLYASSGSEKRALDENDRLGWYEQLPSNYSKIKTEPSKNSQTLAERLSGTPGEFGGWVGFQIGSRGQTAEQRMESKKITTGTRIEFVTEGLLLQKLKNQQELANYDCVIVDEAHERSKDTDLLMALLRKQLQKENCKVKVVVMSASINQQQFSHYFDQCPIIECEGKMFDVEEIYKPVPQDDSVGELVSTFTNSMTNSSSTSFANEREEQSVLSNYSSFFSLDDDIDNHNELFGKNKLVIHAVDILFNDVHSKEKGDVLVFLPGKKEIHNAVDLIRERAERQFAGSSWTGYPSYVRKVVCCTNIAETSLTIPGVKFVIDVGQAKKITYDHELRISALVLNSNSQASAKQRKGRAGRIEPGFCYRLCSKEDFVELEEFDTPELKQCPIDELYLYAVSTFGSMEELELMPDAEPCEKSVQFAKQRLLNLEFIQVTEKRSELDKVELTSEGKLAVSLLGELSIEDIRMILSSRHTGMLKHALQLAVLMKNSNDLQVKEPTSQMTEKFNVYLDELGDAFTWFKIYKTYLEIKGAKKSSQMITNSREWSFVKSGGVKKWCDDLGLSLSTLHFIDKSIDSVYQTLKRQQMLGNGLEDLDLPLCKLRSPLCKALISGYFHNTAELHDINLIKAGYSMLTGANIERPMCPESENDDIESHSHLLKLELSNRSSLTKHGDVVQNSYLVFTNLFKTVSTGRVFMQQACRVTPQMIMENSSANWQTQCQLKPLSFDRLQSVVTRHSEEFIGPKILAAILKTNEKKKYLKELEDNSGAKVNFMSEHGQIRVYGSRCEVENVLEHSSLRSDITRMQNQCLESDFKVPYPLGNRKKLGSFQPGLHLDFSNVMYDEAKIFEEWKSVKTSYVIFRKIDHNKTDKLEQNISNMKLKCPDIKLKSEWGNPRIPDKGKWTIGSISYCKMAFRSENVAMYVCNNFQFYKKDDFIETQCFLDNNEEVPVIDTRIYPSVLEMAENDSNIEVKTRGGYNPCFVICPAKKKHGGRQYDYVKRFKDKLFESGILSSKKVQNINFGLPIGFDQENAECLKLVERTIQEKCNKVNYKLVLHSTAKPFIEIFGDDKNQVAKMIQKIILEIKSGIRGQTLSLLYFKEIKLERHQYTKILRELDQVRANYPEVELKVKSGSHFSRTDLVKPTIQIMTRVKTEGEQCSRHIRKVLENSGKTSAGTLLSDNRCCMCLKEVVLTKYVIRNERNERKSDLFVKIDDIPNVKQLTLCGCIYCPSCLFISVQEQIQNENFAKTGLKCANASKSSKKVCHQTILNQDLKDNLTCKRWEQVLNDAWNSHEKFWERNPTATDNVVLQTCPKCEKKLTFHQNSQGIFSCSKCKFSPYYCVMCKCRVTNEIEFGTHQMMCMAKTKLVQMTSDSDDDA